MTHKQGILRDFDMNQTTGEASASDYHFEFFQDGKTWGRRAKQSGWIRDALACTKPAGFSVV
jgi:hypothetical protein